MSETNYFARRADQEARLSAEAKHPAAAEAHQQLCFAYRARSVTSFRGADARKN